MPTIVYTPFAIFSGIVPLFDINFFNPSTEGTQVVNIADLLASNSLGTVTNGKSEFGETQEDVDARILYNKVAMVADWGVSFTYYYEYLNESGEAKSYENGDNVNANFIKERIKNWVSKGVLYFRPEWFNRDIILFFQNPKTFFTSCPSIKQKTETELFSD